MDKTQQAKLAKAKSQTMKNNVSLVFDNGDFVKIHEKLSDTQEVIQELLQKDTNQQTDQHLLELNNKLVTLINKFELNGKAIEKFIDSNDKSQTTQARDVIKAITAIKMPEPTEIPDWLASDKTLKSVVSSLTKVDKKLSEVAKAATQSQQPEDYVPFRRVRKVGTRLEFDDGTWGGGSGGGVGVVMYQDSAGASQYVSSSNPLPTTATINTGDIEIGGVEIKDGTTDQRAGVDSSGGLAVSGTIASAAADSGNPVKVGGKVNSTLPTFADGQRADMQLDARGGVYTVIKSSGGASAAGVVSDADASANNVGLVVSSRLAGYNGTTWDRIRAGDTGDGGSGVGSLRSLNWAYNGSTYDRLRTISSYNSVASATGMQGVVPLVYGVGGVSTTAGSMKSVDGLTDGFGGAGAPAGVNFLYNGTTFDRPRTATGATTGTAAVSPLAATSGGATPYKLVSAATTNATSVKGSAGNVYSVVATNVNASVRFLKLYDKATAPTVGSDTPVQIYALPGNANGAGISLALSIPLTFSLGIAFAITGGIADSDTTAISANDVAVSLGYK